MASLYTGTSAVFALSLTDGTGAAIPTSGPPVWSITSQLNLDSTPAPYSLIALTVSADGLRASVKAADRAGTAAVQATALIAGRSTVVATLTINITAAPIIAPGAVTAAFAQLAPGPI